eukprot:6245616-Ditylum_brightwellii.AAC.1
MLTGTPYMRQMVQSGPPVKAALLPRPPNNTSKGGNASSNIITTRKEFFRLNSTRQSRGR